MTVLESQEAKKIQEGKQDLRLLPGLRRGGPPCPPVHGRARRPAPGPDRWAQGFPHESKSIARMAGILACALLAACAGVEEKGVAGTPETIRFEDVTAAAGITFVHRNGASERRYLAETMGSGVAAFDADGDGLVDLFFVGGSEGQGGALYKSLGRGRFRDISAGSGLEEGFLGMGTAIGDVDGDGDLDLFVSGVGIAGKLRGDHLFLNQGSGHFADVSQEWGLDPLGFGTSAAFFDLETDGDLDLFVGRYVEWSPESDRECRPNGVDRSYCTPEAYPSASSKLYRNEGGERFVDISVPSGIASEAGKTLGVVAFDLDHDGDTDLALANDTARNFLFRNLGDGRFAEVGVEAGIAVGPSGAPRGAMGIDASDLDGDLLEDLLIGNFAQEMSALFLQSRPGLFFDEASRLGLGVPTLMNLAFGSLIADFDNDGRADVAILNGHIEPGIHGWQPNQQYAQPLQIFRNESASFTSVAALGPLGEAYVGRGLATLDFDQDGDLDLVLTQNGGPARLLRNDSPPGKYLMLEAKGRAAAKTPYGLRVLLGPEGKEIATASLASGRSYLSSSEPLLHLGLGKGPAERLEIVWPHSRQILAGPLEGRIEIKEP